MLAKSCIKVSVIVPVYNAAEYLRECVDSIIQQTYKNIEVILIDDGSSDNSGAICDEYAENDERVKVIHNTNHGVSHARNCGIEVATGECLCFVDSDDYVNKSFIEKLVAPIKHEKYELVVCRHFSIDKMNNNLEHTTELEHCSGFLKEDYWLIADFLGGPIEKLYDRELLIKNQINFDEKQAYSEDRVFNTKYYELVNKYYFVNEALYYIVDRNPNSLSKATSLKAFDSAISEVILTCNSLKNNGYNNYQDVVYSLIMGVTMHFVPCSSSDYGYEIYKSRVKKIKDLVDVPVRKRSVKSRLGFWLLKHGFYRMICMYTALKRILISVI